MLLSFIFFISFTLLAIRNLPPSPLSLLIA
jgi:hypothetical protein